VRMRVLDITQPWTHTMPTWPTFAGIECTPITTHARDGKSSLSIKLNMHTGTHIDAPSHYCETGRDLGKVGLDELVGTGLVIDVSKYCSNYSLFSLEQVLEATPEPIRERDIVIFHTGWWRYGWCYEDADEVTFFDRHPGPTPDLVDYLVKKKIKWMGVDTPAIDHPMWLKIRNIRPDLVRECEEVYGKPIEEAFPIKYMEYCHYTFARNDILAVEIFGKELQEIVNRRVTLGAFPWRWVGGEGCVCRCAAFLED